MYYLRDHLLPGSFRPSYADTDSMCLGLSRSKPIPENASPEEFYRCLFDPLVRPEMRDSWESSWKSWFVTTNDVEDQRKPGKLKSKFELCMTYLTFILEEFSISEGHFVALSPKCYYTFNSTTKEVKKGTKGVPHNSDLVIENFIAKLYGKIDHTVQLRSLRVIGGEMSRTIQDRKSLSDLFCKFHVQSDRITCKPLSLNNQYL